MIHREHDIFKADERNAQCHSTKWNNSCSRVRGASWAAAARPTHDQLTIQHTRAYRRTRLTRTGDVKRLNTRRTRGASDHQALAAHGVPQGAHPPAQNLELCAPTAGRRCHELCSTAAQTCERVGRIVRGCQAAARRRRPGSVAPSAGGATASRPEGPTPPTHAVHPWGSSALGRRADTVAPWGAPLTNARHLPSDASYHSWL